MDIIGGVKIDLHSTDIEEILREWISNKMKEKECHITSSNIEGNYPTSTWYGQKTQHK